jgi:hypothetical protein
MSCLFIIIDHLSNGQEFIFYYLDHLSQNIWWNNQNVFLRLIIIEILIKYNTNRQLICLRINLVLT